MQTNSYIFTNNWIKSYNSRFCFLRLPLICWPTVASSSPTCSHSVEFGEYFASYLLLLLCWLSGSYISLSDFHLSVEIVFFSLLLSFHVSQIHNIHQIKHNPIQIYVGFRKRFVLTQQVNLELMRNVCFD